MKIVGGSFGLKGKVYISRDNMLVIEGVNKSIYSSEEIGSISARTEKEKKFSILSFIVGAIILSILFGIFLNILGVAIGVVIAIFGSYYSNKENIVDIKFIDGKEVKLNCTPRGAKKLIQFAPV